MIYPENLRIFPEYPKTQWFAGVLGAEWKMGDSDLFGVRNSGFRGEMIEMEAFSAGFRGFAGGLHRELRVDAGNGLPGCW